jgi:hypothetical protein
MTDPADIDLSEVDLALVGCTKSKRDHESAARDLYDESPLFRRRRKVAQQVGVWRILSAEHGLVHPDELLETYDTHISEVDREAWARSVVRDLDADAGDTLLLLAGGRDYVDPIRERLEPETTVHAPLRSLSPGLQYEPLDTLIHGKQTTLGGDSA